jgi:putative peptidoglycan binding protein/uncharacterized protein DUF1236
MLLTAPAVACKDDFDRVIQDEDQQERLDWKFAQAFNNRCAAYLRQGDYGRAMQDCNQAVRYDAKNAVAFSNRGLAYAGFALSVGTAVPSSVRIVEVPSALIEINPQWRGHQYFVVRDEIVIVDHSRKIVAVVPVGSSGGAALHSGGGASSAAALNLTEEQIRQIQIVLNEKGFSIGRPDGRLGPRTIRALTEFQRRQGLEVSGRLDSRTVSALGVSNVSGAQGGGSQGAGQSSTTGQGGAAQHQAPAQQNQGKEPSTSGQSGGQGGQHTPSQQKEGASKPSTSGQGSSQQTPAQRLPNEQHENADSK